MLLCDATPRVLVRLPSWLGDLVMSEPAVRALYQQYERAGRAERIALVAPRRVLGVWDAQFPLARRIALERRGAEVAREWRGHDVALLFNNSIRSAWIAWRAGIRERVGWSRGARELLLTDALRAPRESGGVPLGIGKCGAWPRWLPRPYASACIELVQHVGVPVRDTRARLVVSAAARAAAEQRLARFGLGERARFVLVNAGGRAESAKTAPTWLFAPALRALWDEQRVPSVLVCGPDEERVLESLHGRLGGAQSHACSAPIAGLGELAALCERACVVLTADGGPRHVAQAVGARVLCVCGPTDPRHTGDHAATTRVLHALVPCGPCHRETCALPRADELACWRRLGAERVSAELRALVSMT